MEKKVSKKNSEATPSAELDGDRDCYPRDRSQLGPRYLKAFRDFGAKFSLFHTEEYVLNIKSWLSHAVHSYKSLKGAFTSPSQIEIPL